MKSNIEFLNQWWRIFEIRSRTFTPIRALPSVLKKGVYVYGLHTECKNSVSKPVMAWQPVTIEEDKPVFHNMYTTMPFLALKETALGLEIVTATRIYCLEPIVSPIEI